MEKVSRPDKAGVWIKGGVLGLFDIKRNGIAEVYPYGVDEHIHRSDDYYHIANQAIEKMIASAREKE